MVAATTAELTRLGVPFFNTRTDLLLPKSSGTPGRKRGHDDDDADGEKGGKNETGKNKLDEAQLRELQAKMLGLLEDLCSE